MILSPNSPCKFWRRPGALEKSRCPRWRTKLADVQQWWRHVTPSSHDADIFGRSYYPPSFILIAFIFLKSGRAPPSFGYKIKDQKSPVWMGLFLLLKTFKSQVSVMVRCLVHVFIQRAQKFKWTKTTARISKHCSSGSHTNIFIENPSIPIFHTCCLYTYIIIVFLLATMVWYAAVCVMQFSPSQVLPSPVKLSLHEQM